MTDPTRSNKFGRNLFLCVLVLTLALVLPAIALAQVGGPNPGDAPGSPPGGPPGGATPQPTTQPTPSNPPPNGPGNGNGPGPIPTATPAPGNGGMNGGGMNGGGMMGPPAHELANRVVKHVATPVQLVVAGDGFQFFFIGADGSTVSGPVLPGFAALAEMHPSGDWVSLLDAVNPLTGKQVYVDYIPKDMAIRVFTYYPDKGMDVNKPYIFNFGADLAVNVEAW